MQRVVLRVMAASAWAACGFCQQPTIQAVRNAGSGVGPPIVPQMLVSIYGQDLATQPVSSSIVPLPVQLGGTSVSINGISAPLLYASPSQINAQVPAGLRDAQSASIVVTTTSGVSVPFTSTVNPAGAPGIFTQNGSGCGQAAALNVHADGSTTVNTPQNSFDPLNDAGLAIFLTGLGPFADRVDGVPWQYNANDNVGDAYRLLMGNPEISYSSLFLNVTYAGPAPGTIGGDQVNAIPFPGDYLSFGQCHMPVYLFRPGVSPSYSQLVNISIQPGGGACSDPPANTLGMINWEQNRTSNSAGVSTSLTVTAQFLSGPNLVFPLQLQGFATASELITAGPGFCAASYPATLDAGSLALSGPGVDVTMNPEVRNGLLTYRTTLGPGTFSAGAYTVAASGGKDVGPFSATASVPAPVALTSAFPPGSQQSPFGGTLQWTGGDPSSDIHIELIERYPNEAPYVVAPGSGPATSGSLVYIPIGSPMAPPPSGTPMEVLVVQYPSGDPPSQPFAAPGLTLGGEQNWRYIWDFRGLVSQ